MEERFLNSARNCTALTCAAILGVFTLGTNKLAAQFFLACMDFFNVGRKEASFPFTLVHIIRSMSGPLTGYLGRKYGALAVTEFGCFLCVVGVGGGFFAKNITTVSILWGVVYGLGTGLGGLLIPHILRDFFDKHFDKAHGYYVAGSGVTGFFLPLLAEVLLNQYGLPGAFLVLSAMILNFIPMALILRTLKRGPQMYQKSALVVEVKNTEIQKAEMEELSASKLKAPGLEQGSTGTARCNSQDSKVHSVVEPNEANLSGTRELFAVPTPPEKSSSPDILKEVNVDIENQVKESSTKKENLVLEVFQIFLDPSFDIILITQCFFIFIYQTFNTTVIDIGRDFGVPPDKEVYTFMILAITDVVGRLAFGYVTDGGCLSQLNFYVLSFILLGIMIAALTVINSILVFMIALSVIGLVLGGLAMISVGLMYGFIAKEKMIIAMPCRFFLYPFFGFSKPFLIEIFREGQGSYNGLLFLLSGFCVVSAFLSLLLPATKRFKEKRGIK